jgi:hypothetical protein
MGVASVLHMLIPLRLEGAQGGDGGASGGVNYTKILARRKSKVQFIRYVHKV